MSHFDDAERYLAVLAQQQVADHVAVATAAQAHATLSLVEAVEALLLRPDEPAAPAVPFEQTKDGWKW